jgi:hypothetical protein
MTSAQAELASKRIETAVNGFQEKFEKKNGRKATGEEIAAFAGVVTGAITNSITSTTKSADDKAERAVRTQNVLAAAKAAGGVKFFHRREHDAIDHVVSIEKITDRIYEEIVNVEIVNATLGGQTFAYKYVLDENNDLFMVYTTAFCRNDEPFDPLIGMEIALDKFQNGLTFQTPIQHERFGQVKLTQLAKKYKSVENFRSAPEAWRSANRQALDSVFGAGESAEAPAAAIVVFDEADKTTA